jgi:CRISPR-associated endonuclease/helicase Cas3
VYRAIAPPDSLQQAAGRANREGRLGSEGGEVVVFEPADGGMPAVYRTQIGKADRWFGTGKTDPDNLEALRDYFRALYLTLNLDGGVKSTTIRRNRRRLDFRAVTEGPERGHELGRNRTLAFRMIDDDTVPVVVSYHDGVFRSDWIDELRTAPAPRREMLTRLQPYTTTIRRKTRCHKDVDALCRPILGDMVEWVGGYDDAGLVLTPKEGEFIA